MELLHAELTETIRTAIKVTETKEVVKDEESGDETEVVRVALPASAWAAVAVAFLKNNSVTMAPAQGNALGDMEAELEAMRKRRTMPSEQDRKDALAAIGSSLLQ